MKRSTAAVAIAAALLLAGCTAAPSAGPAPSTTSQPTATASTSTPTAEPATFWRVAEGTSVLASGLDVPWSVVPLAEGGALISLRDQGVVDHLMPDGQVVEAGTVPGVAAYGEGGLLGLAVLADGGSRWLYAYFSAADDNEVVRMPLTGTGTSLALGSPETILTGIARGTIHNGGRLAFGPDGMLYVSTGETGDHDYSQDPSSLNGKILRMTPTGQPAPGNPFGTLVWSLGHRNVQGMAWTADGTMWASEFGQDTWDELNRIEPGGNYGWPIVEGQAGDSRFVDPVAQWPTDQASPSGIAAVGQTVFMTGLRGQRLWQIDVSDGVAIGDPVPTLTDQGRLRDAVVAPDGSLWVLTSNTDGRGDPRDGDDLLLRVPVAAGD